MRITIIATYILTLLLIPTLARAQEATDSVPPETAAADSIAAAAADSIAEPASVPTLKPTLTPVDIDREKPEQPALHYYDKHGNPLQTPEDFSPNSTPSPSHRKCRPNSPPSTECRSD